MSFREEVTGRIEVGEQAPQTVGADVGRRYLHSGSISGFAQHVSGYATLEVHVHLDLGQGLEPVQSSDGAVHRSSSRLYGRANASGAWDRPAAPARAMSVST